MKKTIQPPIPSRLVTKIIVLFLFLMFTISLNAQDTIITKIDSIQVCQSGNLIVPVQVSNFIGVSGFSLALNIDPTILSYSTVQDINPKIMGGNLLIFQAGATVKVSWINPVSGVTIPDGILFDFVFNTIPGSCPLIWDKLTPGECEYTDSSSTIIPDFYINGYVTNHLFPLVDLGIDTTICYYETLTLFAGNPGSSYLWSTNETTDSIFCSAVTDTVISYNVIVADSVGCNSNDTIIVTFDTCSSNFMYAISGKLIYDDTLNPHQPIINTLLILHKTNGVTVDSTYTDINGIYHFINVPIGSYNIEVECTKAWGGGGSNDALMIMKHFSKLIQLTGLKLKAGDIDGSGAVNATDALYVAQRFVFMINSFPVGDWVFENDLTTINSSNVIYIFKGLCVGDVNGSYIVPK